jgi:hypothetical protein
MIDGLKLTLTGEELRRMLQERADHHRASASRWSHEAARTPDEQTEEEPLLPEHMCENEAERHEWRAEMLEFIREHLEPLEVYRLSESDLAFGELLPQAPGSVEQDEYEERTRVGFELGRLAKRVCLSPEIIQITNADARTGE